MYIPNHIVAAIMLEYADAEEDEQTEKTIFNKSGESSTYYEQLTLNYVNFLLSRCF